MKHSTPGLLPNYIRSIQQSTLSNSQMISFILSPLPTLSTTPTLPFHLIMNGSSSITARLSCFVSLKMCPLVNILQFLSTGIFLTRGASHFSPLRLLRCLFMLFSCRDWITAICTLQVHPCMQPGPWEMIQGKRIPPTLLHCIVYSTSTQLKMHLRSQKGILIKSSVSCFPQAASLIRPPSLKVQERNASSLVSVLAPSQHQKEVPKILF